MSGGLTDQTVFEGEVELAARAGLRVPLIRFAQTGLERGQFHPKISLYAVDDFGYRRKVVVLTEVEGLDERVSATALDGFARYIHD
jgi:hypothetical protein